MTTYIAQQLSADNDPNGNPQRLTTVFRADDDDGVRNYATRTETIDHGYRFDSAEQAFRFAYGDVPVIILPTVHISRSDYHRLVKGSI